MYIPTEIHPLSRLQVSKLLKGHSVRVKHGKGMKVHLSQQQHKKLMSSHMKGKGCNLCFDPYQMDIHGEGLFSSALKVGKTLGKDLAMKAGKSLGKEAVKLASKEASRFVPSVLTNALEKEALKRIDGQGFLSSAMNAGKKLASSKIGKSLAKQAVKAASKQASNYIPPSVANAIASEAVDRIDGQGFFDSAVKGIVSAGKKVAGNKIVRKLGNAVGAAGQEAFREGRKQLVPAVAKALSGSGARGRKSKGGALYPAGMGVDVYYE